MVTNAPPANGELTINGHILKGCTAVGVREGPGQFPDAGRVLNGLEAQGRWPPRQGAIASARVRLVEYMDGLAKKLTLLLRQTPVVAAKVL